MGKPNARAIVTLVSFVTRMNADRGLEENVRLYSRMFAYVRLMGEKMLKALRAKCSTDRDWGSCNSPLRVRRAMSAVGDFSIKNQRFNRRQQRRIESGHHQCFQ